MNNRDQKTAAKSKQDTYQTATSGDTGEAYTTYLTTYVNLRTVLDSLQDTGLRWVLKSDDIYERTKRAEELASEVKSLMARVEGGPSPEGQCGDGYYNCGGVCVPYPCPFASKY